MFFHIRMHLRNSRDSLVSCNPSTLTHIRRKIQPATLRGPTEWRLFPGSLVYLTCVRWPQWEEWVYLSSLDPFPILRSDRETTWVQPRKWKQDELLEIPFHPTSWQMMNPSLRGTQPTQLISLEDPSALLSFNEEASTLNYEKKMGRNTFKSIFLSLVSKITKKHTTFFFFLAIQRCHELLAVIDRLSLTKELGPSNSFIRYKLENEGYNIKPFWV